MSKPQKQDGIVYARKDGKVLWIRYRDRNGKRCRESAGTEDWQEANRKLRERLQARDGNLGGFFSRELFETSHQGCENSRSELALCQPSEGCLLGKKTGGDHSRRH
jgi:hypothetical protein